MSLQGHFNVGDSVQGVISSIEDEGVIIDIGAGEESKGFMPQSSVKSTDRLALGKSVTFVVTEVLLDGRQVSLDLQRSQETAFKCISVNASDFNSFARTW